MSFPVRFMHAMLRVADMERTLGFYRGLLGMKVRVDRLDSDGYRNVFIGSSAAGDGASLEFGARPGVGPDTRSGTGFDHIALETADVVATCAMLRAAGIAILRDVRRAQSGALIAIVEDPDGYRIELIQPSR